MHLDPAQRRRLRHALANANPGGLPTLTHRPLTDTERAVLDRFRAAESARWGHVDDRSLAIHLTVDEKLTPARARRLEAEGRLSTQTLLADFTLAIEVGYTEGAIALRRVLEDRGELPELSSDRVRAAVDSLNALPGLVGTRAQLDAADAAARHELHCAIIEVVETRLGLHPKSVFVGGWECPGGPTGTCVYDPDLDPWHDSCLFCFDPAERK